VATALVRAIGAIRAGAAPLARRVRSRLGMRAPRLRPALRRAREAAGCAWRAVITGIRSAGATLSYRRREAFVIGGLAVSVVGGFVVDAWHRRAPLVLDRLETEAPRSAAARASPPPGDGSHRRARAEAQAGWRPRVARAVSPPAPPAPSVAHPLDLNRASPADLGRLPGIGPRLAGRIVARRDAVGGHFDSADDLATVPGLGARRAALLRPLVTVGAADEAANVPPPAGEGP
jgi:Helix-hairpin-helix motif